MKKRKILYCTTVDYHLKAFHLPYMKWFKEHGWDVDVVASGDLDLPYTDNKYNIPIQRSPFNRKNLAAYRQIKRIIEENHYAIIHCHTPLGGVLGRLAARQARKYGTKVIYTAHGFHFYKGGPLINWLLYYPIEKLLARLTDSLITINTEDFTIATKRRFNVNEIVQIPGVGVDTEQFKPINKQEQIRLKRSFGYEDDDFLLFNAAEFNKNKNQAFLIHALALLKDEVPNVKLLLAGEGPLLASCRELAQQLGISHMVEFLGFRKDIQTIIVLCDVAVASSYREGLPVAVMEAMACGLPVVAVDNRGHRELIQDDYNGWLNTVDDPQAFANKLTMLATIQDLPEQFGKKSRQLMVKKYSTKKVLREKSRLYQQYMDEQGETTWGNKAE
ncbi:MAG TPA: glycosyltransferase family 4 protein [Virgibacillus sp.]|nr:glycosyltransferase family 4 protein [Virgibacillus sp.]